MYLYFMSNIAEKWKKIEIGMKHVFIWSEIKYDINSKISYKKIFVPLKKNRNHKNFITK